VSVVNTRVERYFFIVWNKQRNKSL